MPADIATINGAPAVAYQGETPWHSLGTPMHEADVPKALEAARLDWTVSLKKLSYRHGDKHVTVPNRKAVVRDSDGKLLATVGNTYVPKQNAEAFGVLQPACERFGVTIETAGALGKGDRVWMLAKLPEAVEPIPGDTINGYALVVTGHNGWTPHSGRLTQVRVVCANTLALALRDKAFMKLNHVGDNAKQLDQMAEMITMMVAAMKTSAESFKRLAAHRLTGDALRQYVNAVLDTTDTDITEQPVLERRRDTIIELAATGKGVAFAPESAWAALNAVTEYIDHVRPAEAKSPKTIKQANASAIFGANAKLKTRALVLARQLAA